MCQLQAIKIVSLFADSSSFLTLFFFLNLKNTFSKVELITKGAASRLNGLKNLA